MISLVNCMTGFKPNSAAGTPLTVLAGFVETLRDAPDGALTGQQREQYFGLMAEQAQQQAMMAMELATKQPELAVAAEAPAEVAPTEAAAD